MATLAFYVKKYYGYTSSNMTNKVTTAAKSALGFADVPTNKLTPEQFESVVNWFRNDAVAKGKYKPATESNSTSVQEQETTLTATESKSVRKMGLKGVDTTRFQIKQDAKYLSVYLEPEFIAALDVIASPNKKEWLMNVIAVSGQRNPASAIRGALVNELLNRVGIK